MLNRRLMLKSTLLTGTATLMGGMLGTRAVASEQKSSPIGAPWATNLGWHLGSMLYTFYQFTFEEAVQKMASLGMRVACGFGGQRIVKGQDDVMNFNLNKEQRYLVRSILADNDVAMVCYGGVDVTPQSIEFALDMGVGTLLTEPVLDTLPEVDKLANEYKINVALHNHPKPSHLWNYHTTLERIKDLSPRIGFCVDTGHFMRSGLSPLQAVKDLKGRIIELHVKDLNNTESGCHDVPWGTGVCDIAAILAELREQRFRGNFFVEYEHNMHDSVGEIAECVRFFNEQARVLCLP